MVLTAQRTMDNEQRTLDNEQRTMVDGPSGHSLALALTHQIQQIKKLKSEEKSGANYPFEAPEVLSELCEERKNFACLNTRVFVPTETHTVKWAILVPSSRLVTRKFQPIIFFSAHPM